MLDRFHVLLVLLILIVHRIFATNRHEREVSREDAKGNEYPQIAQITQMRCVLPPSHPYILINP